MFADLHLHTNFSDGTFTPEELADRGQKAGLGTMSLTDHDTVEGCARMGAACAERGIRFISGTELTAEIEGNEVHLLGYFIDTENPTLLGEMKKYQSVRQSRIHEMVKKLNELNIPLKAETVFKVANCKSPGRPHVGRALVQEGYCANMDEAFDRFLKKHRPAFVPKMRVSASEAIDLVHNAGGLAVMAHPGLNRTDELIPRMVDQGLDGIECFHTKHSPSTSEHYLKIAARYNLLVTGGSDCHGYSKGKPLIGSVKLSGDHLEKLIAAHEARKNPRR